MDSILVVCYSYTGRSRRAAQILCSRHGWPLAEILDTAPRTPGRCFLDSVLRRRPAIRYSGPDPADFHTVVLVAPVWVYRLAGPMRTFVARHRQALSRVAVVATMNAAGAKNVFDEVSRMLGHRPIGVAALTERELGDQSGSVKLFGFADGLQPVAKPGGPLHALASGAPA